MMLGTNSSTIKVAVSDCSLPLVQIPRQELSVQVSQRNFGVQILDAECEVLTAVTNKITVFWVVTPCSSEKYIASVFMVEN
jgi:hypothetical protein